MALLNDPLQTDPLGSKQEEPDGLYKTATEAFDRVSSMAHGIRRPDEQPTMLAQANPTGLADALFQQGGRQGSIVTNNGSPAGGLADLLFNANNPQPKPVQTEQGDFSRGLSVSGKQLKQTAYGTAALIGDTVGAEGLKDWGLKGYQAAEKEVKAISKESDSFTNAIQSGEIGKWLSYSSGYLLGQVGELGVASLAGAALGTLAAPGGGTIAGAAAGAIEKGAVEAGVKTFVGKMIDKQVAANVARGMSAEAATQAAVKTVYGTIGATTANTFLNATQELGSIYGDAVEQAALTGQEYSLGKVWLSGIMATAVDSWADSKAVGKLMDSMKGGKGVGGIAMEAFKGGFREGMTEGVQTAIERWGADKDLASQEAFKEYIDSAAVGVLGGSTSGAGAATVKKALSPSDKPKVDADLSEADISTEGATDKAQPKLEAPVSIERDELLSILRTPEAMAYLYQNADDEQKVNIEKAIEKAGAIDAFNAAKGQMDAIQSGEKMFSEFPEYQQALEGAIAGYAKRPNLNIQKGNTLEAPPSQFDEMESQTGIDAPTQEKLASRKADPSMGPSDPIDLIQGRVEKPMDRVVAYLQTANLSDEMRNDPLIARAAAASAVAFKNEKASDPRNWTPEESAAWKAKDWEKFSKVRGYTDKEIAQYRKFQDLINQVREKYGDDAVFEIENPYVQKGVYDSIYGKGAYRAQEKIHSDVKVKADVAERQQEMRDMLSTVDEVYNDTGSDSSGLRFSSRAKPTVSELPGVIKTAMSNRIKTGSNRFIDVAMDVMKLIRGTERFSEIGKSITPNMLRTAYKSLPANQRQSDAEVDAVTANQLRDAVKSTFDNSGRPSYRQGTYQYVNKKGETITVTDQRPLSARAFVETPGSKEAGPDVDFGQYEKKEKAPPRKQLAFSRQTPEIKRYLSTLRPADQKEALLTLGSKTDEELKQISKRLAESEEREKARQEEASKGQLELDVSERQPPALSYPAREFEREIGRLVAMRDDTAIFRKTLADMQAALTEIDNTLRGQRTIETKEGDKFVGKDLSDEYAYLWSDDVGFRIPKNLPQEKLLAARRRLADQVRQAQEWSIEGQADLFKNSISHILRDLHNAWFAAQKNTTPEEKAQIDKLYDEAGKMLSGIKKELDKNPDAVTKMVPETFSKDITDAVQGDFFESDKAIRLLVDGLGAERREQRLSPSEAAKIATRAMRNGEFTFGELMNVLREKGVSIPHELFGASGHVAMQTRMVEHVRNNGYAPVYREQWLRSMNNVVQQFPSLLDGDAFSDGEKLAYQEWKEARDNLRSRRKVDEVMQYSNDVDEAFPGLLFMDYTLARLRNPDAVSTRQREAMRDTLGDPVEAWFQDVAHALLTRPDLRRQIEERIRPEEMTEFREWLKKREDAVNREAEMTAALPYYKALLDLPLSDVTYEGYKAEMDKAVALRQMADLQRILDNAQKLADSVEFGSTNRAANLDLQLEAVSQARRDFEMVNGQSYEQFFGMDEGGRKAYDVKDESVEDLAADEEFDFSEDSAFQFDDGETNPDEDAGLRERKGFFSGVVTAANVQEWVAKVTSRWKNAPQITVLQNAGMLPEPLRGKVLERTGDVVDAAGLFDPETGHVYLFSDFISGESDTHFTLFHEVYGHYGLRAFLGEKFDAFLEQMYRVYPNVAKAADEKIAGGMPKLEAIDEALADMAGTNPDIPAVKSWIGRIVVGLREIGLGKVADWIASISNVELAYYLKGAREAAQNGGYVANGAPSSVRLAEAVQHERLSEMYSLKGDKTTAFARFNPVTQEWFVYLANGDDVRGLAGLNNTALITGNYNDVLKLMRSKGHVEFRKRSGVFVQDRGPANFAKLTEITNLTGMKAWMRSMITKYQNEYRPVFDLVDAIRAKGMLSERMDIKDALLRYERKTGAVVDEFRRRFVRPLESLVDEAGKQGANSKIIDRYLLARHAAERNKQIAKINEQFPDGGSGMKTKTAMRYLKQLEKQPYWQTLEEIGRITDAISAKKLKYQFDTGMITAKQYQAMQVYKHYVNLSGRSDLNLDGFDDPMMLAGGSKFNVKGKEKRALGRQSEATEILSRTILGMEAALIRGQKNQVAQRVLAFFEANYDPNFATINKIAYKPVIGEDGMVTDKEDDSYIRNPNVMVAKINGIPNTIEFKDTSAGSFAEAIHGVVGMRDSNAVLERLGKFNQIVGQMLTTWNPAWGFVNFARDLQTMFFNAAADGRITKAQAAQMVKTIPEALKIAYYMARTENLKKTNIDLTTAQVEVYREMKMSGGLTSFLNRKDLESQVAEIESLLGERSKLQNAGDKFMKVMDAIEHNFSLPIEIAPRLAAYKVMREAGWSPAQAAQFAGEITVNFNMRGSVKATRQLYLFFNPAVQGSAKLLSLFGTLTPDYKLKFKTKGFAYVGLWVGLGAMMNLIGRAFSDDDEAGRNALDKLPVYKRATSMVFSADTPGAAIPIPYGWNAFYAMGHFMMDSLLGIQPITTSVKRIAQTAFESFAPLGSAGLDSQSIAGTALKGVAPTAALPIVEWVMNENRYGAPIRREDSVFGGAKLPDSSMAFRSVNPLSDAVMKGLNEVTGGNKFKSGKIDINPAAVDFVIGSYMPGFINESYKAAGMAARVSRGEEVKNTPMPLVDRFTAKTQEGFDAGAFRRAKEMVETAYNEYTNVPARRDEIRKELPGLMRAHAVVTSINQDIRELNATLNTIENSARFSEAEKVKRLNQTRERVKMLQSRAVKAVMQAGPEFRDAVMASD